MPLPFFPSSLSPTPYPFRRLLRRLRIAGGAYPIYPLLWDNDRAQRNLVLIKENKGDPEEKLRVLPKIAELFW